MNASLLKKNSHGTTLKTLKPLILVNTATRRNGGRVAMMVQPVPLAIIVVLTLENTV
jgi:hypothetical protein